ncbi:hypothetical protein [Segnochrobactrum spirostomi]|uniref:CoxF protein n=1 Tax=Segnochrobactrum spirostomi TaxID=2608987 RepID=A0A6A7Y740_9HYPH|nr:hypothetical protein [Segnochrobactrum spirostomi]MQT13901.1 hypothetical protein [Segnochrobactrum spirostomi]
MSAAAGTDIARDGMADDQKADEDGIRLTPAQLRRRRARSLAIALVLGGLVILFYVVTIVKLGGNVLNRPM